MYQGGRELRPLPTQPEGLPVAHCPTEQRGSPVWSPPAPSKRGDVLRGDLPKATRLSAAEPESNLISVPRKMGTEKREGEGEGSRAGGTQN